MNFEKDVFISYAHIDDESLSEGVKGWITEFHKSLEVRLSQILGDVPKIWRDAKLQGNDFFSPEIEAQFPKLKIMISVITPRYVKSEWCTKEVELFYKAAGLSGGIAIENKSRIFKVIKTPVPLDEQPEKIRPLLGYEFFRVNKDSNTTTEYGLFAKEIEYWTKLNDVAYNIADLIEKINDKSLNGNKPDISTTLVSSTTYNHRTIYLAETSYDLSEYRDNLKRELEAKGLTVLPDKNLPLIADKYKQEVATGMNESTLSIHLVGSSYGTVPDGSEKSIVVLQNEIAAQQSVSTGLKRLIWVSPLKATEDKRLSAFIDLLKHKEDLQNGSDLLQGTIDEFKFTIFDTLKKLDTADKEKEIAEAKVTAAQASPAALVTNQGPKTIYLICDQRDRENTKALDDFLFDSGFNVWCSTFDGTQEELMKAHEDSLRDCDAALIYFGNANESWLRTKISELKRKPALSNSRQLLSSMVYLADPSNPQKANYRSHDIKVVNGLNGFNKDLFKDFIEKLK